MERGAPSRTSRVAGWIAFAVCVLVLAAAFLVPTSTIEAWSVSADGTVSDVVTTHRTLAAAEGTGIVLVLAIPLAVVGFGLLVGRTRRWGLTAAAVLAWAWVLATGFTVGLFYVPAAIALTVAAATWSGPTGSPRRAAQHAAYWLAALVIAALPTWLLATVVARLSGGTSAWEGLVPLVYLCFGFGAALVYTYLAEGGRTVRAIFTPRRRTRSSR